MALTRQTFVGKVMSLLFNILSRLVITFLSLRPKIMSPFPQVRVGYKTQKLIQTLIRQETSVKSLVLHAEFPHVHMGM